MVQNKNFKLHNELYSNVQYLLHISELCLHEKQYFVRNSKKVSSLLFIIAYNMLTGNDQFEIKMAEQLNTSATVSNQFQL